MQSYFSGKYWWIGIGATVALTLIFYHGLIDQNPATKPAITIQKPTPKPVKLVRPAVPTHPILDLYNPSTSEITRDQAISRTRSELEQLFVVRILLARCAIITEEEALAINVAALDYATRSRIFSDPATTVQELQAQAQQTHDLVYASTECSEASLHTLKDQTMAWQAQFAPIP